MLGSTIIGLEEHTPENIDKAIEYAVDHDTEFHQFMLYTAVAGTPLHAERQAAGDLLGNDQIALEDTHGQGPPQRTGAQGATDVARRRTLRLPHAQAGSTPFK